MRPEGEITAVLGPTNTGKTHLALTRMLGRSSGVMGLPLRLLAREIYEKVVKAKGEGAAALVTGEEKIVPAKARYFICTVEAMPLDMRPAFLAIDEIQLCGDPDRGHIFTDRLLHARGTEETMFLGSPTMAPMLSRLVPEARHDHRERFSTLSYAGPKKLGKLPRRSAIVAFSAEDVYSIAELIRRQRGGAAVVMGALSPRTRNAQVELYQSGEVDYLIATDAIGMGLNMDVDHVAFAGLSKFDGHRRRRLFPHEIGQIAGRAGRFRSDGTFGETADAQPLDAETIEKVENHRFEAVGRIKWRNADLNFANIEALRNSLNAPSPLKGLERVRAATDETTLEILARDGEIRDLVKSPRDVARLWDVCRTPDFRKTTPEEHARLVKQVFAYLSEGKRVLPEAWLDAQLRRVAKTSGDVDLLSQRIAHVRTWAYAANRSDWTADPEHWRARTREVEDQLSDALHERLMGRFIDRRTSALMRGLRDKADLAAGLDEQGEVTVEGHYVGRLTGLSFRPDAAAGPLARRAVANAALKAVRPEVNRRLGRLAQAEDSDLVLTGEGALEWEGETVARLIAGADPFTPSVRLVGGELGAGEAQARAERRLERYAAARAQAELAPLTALRAAIKAGQGGDRLDGLARGVAYRLAEMHGAAPRADLAADLDQLSTHERRQLRRAGVRIGEHAVFMPALLKPAPAGLNALLKAVHENDPDRRLAAPPGRVSVPRPDRLDAAACAAAGFLPLGPLAVRLDMLERLADLIREARARHPRRWFAADAAMMALLGCSAEDLAGVLKALGYKRVKKAGEDGPELWGGRAARGPKRPSVTDVAPPAPADTPFAALAALDLASKPERPPRKRRARGAKRKATAPAPEAAASRPKRRRRKPKPKPPSSGEGA